MKKIIFIPVLTLLLPSSVLADNTQPITCSDASKMLTTAIKLCCPQMKYFANNNGDDNFARSVWDMQVYDGRIYIGAGDWSKNSGSTHGGFMHVFSIVPTFSLDRKKVSVKIHDEYSITDESIDRFRVYSDKLYIPGIDATWKDDPNQWNWGNFYVRSKTCIWTKRRTIPYGGHVLDIAELNGLLYSTVGRYIPPNSGSATLYESTNGGKSWSIVGDSVSSVRFFEMCPLNGGLFISSQYNGYYYYKNGKFDRVLSCDAYAGYIGGRMTPFKGGVLFINGQVFEQTPRSGLMYIKDIREVPVSIHPFDNSVVKDIVVHDDRCDILVATPTNSNGCYWGEIFTSTDLDNWKKIAKFQVPSMPISFEYLSNFYYIGLGWGNESGSIYMLQ